MWLWTLHQLLLVGGVGGEPSVVVSSRGSRGAHVRAGLNGNGHAAAGSETPGWAGPGFRLVADVNDRAKRALAEWSAARAGLIAHVLDESVCM